MSDVADNMIIAGGGRLKSRAQAYILRDGTVLLPKTTPLIWAEVFIEMEFAHVERPTLAYWRGKFLIWDAGVWRQTEETYILGLIYSFLDKAFFEAKDGQKEKFAATPDRVRKLLDPLKTKVFVAETVKPFDWLDPRRGDLASDRIVPINGGYVDIATWQHRLPTPRLFVTGAASWSYEGIAACPTWHRFLASLWPDDGEEKALLQEAFGLLMSGVTRFEKIFVLLGPTRSGKGTLLKILIDLIGQWQYAPLKIRSFDNNFGLMNMVGKRVAGLPDARFGGRSDKAMIAEDLLAISGRDSITTPIKFKDAIDGPATARIVIATNELPHLPDDAGALAARFVPIVMTRSFADVADAGLIDRLREELPAIAEWASEGFQRLLERNAFVLPASSRKAIAAAREASSPIMRFVRDCCRFDGDIEKGVGPAALLAAWRAWCAEEGLKSVGREGLVGGLKRAYNLEKKRQPGSRGAERPWIYPGLHLLDEFRAGGFD